MQLPEALLDRFEIANKDEHFKAVFSTGDASLAISQAKDAVPFNYFGSGKTETSIADTGEMRAFLFGGETSHGKLAIGSCQGNGKRLFTGAIRESLKLGGNRIKFPKM